MQIQAGFFREKAVSSQWPKDIPEKADRRAVAGMFDLALVFQLVINRFDQGVLAQQDFIAEAHNVALHIFSESGNQLYAVGKQAIKQSLRQIAFVPKELAKQLPGHSLDHFRVAINR